MKEWVLVENTASSGGGEDGGIGGGLASDDTAENMLVLGNV